MKTVKQKEHNGAASLVLRLCLKDFTSSKGISLLVAFFYVLWLAMVVGIGKRLPLVLVFFPILMIDALKRFENKYKTENLFCSLPVKRSSLVYAKYLTSLIMLIITAILSYISVLLLNTLLPMVLRGTGKLVPTQQVFSILIIYVLFAAVSFLIYFRFGYLGYPGGIIVDFLVTIIAVTLTWGILYAALSMLSGSWGLAQYKGKAGLVDGFLNGVSGKAASLVGEPVFFVFVSLLLVAIIYTAINLSVKFYQRRDL